MMATMHNVLPALDFEKLLRIKPMIANGIINQFSQPKSGIKASSIPSKEIMPRKEATIFIVVVLFNIS